MTNRKILMSIHPEHADRIFSGEKKFEFRRKLPKRPFSEDVIDSSVAPQSFRYIGG